MISSYNIVINRLTMCFKSEIVKTDFSNSFSGDEQNFTNVVIKTKW